MKLQILCETTNIRLKNAGQKEKAEFDEMKTEDVQREKKMNFFSVHLLWFAQYFFIMKVSFDFFSYFCIFFFSSFRPFLRVFFPILSFSVHNTI